MINSLTDVIFLAVYLVWAIFLIFSAGWCSNKAEKFRTFKNKKTRWQGYSYLIMFVLTEILFTWFLLYLGSTFLN
ncbi:hypothetical protein GCM10022297_01250 [Lactobacillus hamsteri]